GISEWSGESSFGSLRKPISSRPPAGTTMSDLVLVRAFWRTSSSCSRAFGKRRSSSPSSIVRSVELHDFPYAVYFRETDDSVVVLAVLHLRRRPGLWRVRS